ncbi:MAG: AAA family ATPase [Bryobacteraceae bacterium]
MIRIITIEREYGSGAAAVGKAVADRLGWTLWDHEITCEVARRLKCDVQSVEQREERPDPAFYRLVKVFMRGSYEESLQGSAKLELLDAEHLALLFERIATDIAAKGNSVIIGRGAPWFLRNRDDTLRVFIYASVEEKIRRLKAQGKTQSEAEDLIARVDRERAAFVKQYYGANWPERYLYHVMINSVIGNEAVIKMILSEMDLLDANSRPLTRTGTAQHVSR